MNKLKKIWWVFALLAMLVAFIAPNMKVSGIYPILFFVEYCALTIIIKLKERSMRNEFPRDGIFNRYMNNVNSAPNKLWNVAWAFVVILTLIIAAGDIILAWLTSFMFQSLLPDFVDPSMYSNDSGPYAVTCFILLIIFVCICAILLLMRIYELFFSKENK